MRLYLRRFIFAFEKGTDSDFNPIKSRMYIYIQNIYRIYVLSIIIKNTVDIFGL